MSDYHYPEVTMSVAAKMLYVLEESITPMDKEKNDFQTGLSEMDINA